MKTKKQLKKQLKEAETGVDYWSEHAKTTSETFMLEKLKEEKMFLEQVIKWLF